MPHELLPTTGGMLDFPKFPSSTWNTLVRNSQEFERLRRRQQPAKAPPKDRIYWRNDSGEDAPLGAVVRITGHLTIDNAICVNGEKPDGTLRPLYGVSLDIVADGALGEISLFDACPCHYNDSDGTPAFGESWGVEPGQWYLRKYRPGFFILGNHSGAGTQARVVAQPTPIESVIGKLAGVLNQGSSQTVNVWGGAGGSEAVIAGLTITAYDWFMASGDSIASGSRVKCSLVNGVWYVVQSECPEEE